MSAATIRVGVVGLGYWRRNLVRNFDTVSAREPALSWDTDPDRRDAHADQATNRGRISRSRAPAHVGRDRDANYYQPS